MSTAAARQTVPAPPFRPWRVGLEGVTKSVSSGGTPLFSQSDGEWAAGGIQYRPELAYLRPDPDTEGEYLAGPGSHIICPVDANGVNEPAQDDKAVRRGPGTVEWDAYALYDGDGCTALGSTYDAARARAVRSLELQSSHLVEQILWTGVVNGLDFTANHPNRALAGGAAVDLPNGTTPTGVVTAFSLMVEALSERLGGAQGMIHVPASLLPFLTFYGQVVRDTTNVIYTYAADHVIVAGTGYPGTDPDGNVDLDATWIYGTSFVELRYSSVFVPSDDYPQGAFNPSTNDFAVVAERSALASWDLQAHIGIGVCTPDPGPACATTS